MKTRITRRTILGYAVNTSPSEGPKGYYFETPEKPQWTGTGKTLGEALQGDRFLQSLTTTFYSYAHFVKVGSTWFRVVNADEFIWETDRLYQKRNDGWGEKYITDEVFVDVDYPNERSRAAAAMGRVRTEEKAAIVRANGRLSKGRPRKVA